MTCSEINIYRTDDIVFHELGLLFEPKYKNVYLSQQSKEFDNVIYKTLWEQN